MRAILRMIDLGDVGTVMFAHLDREPIFLYPELDERGWSHEMLQPGEAGSDDGVVLRLVCRRT